MSSIRNLVAPLAAVAFLAGCAATNPGTDVTRFHLSQPIERGTIFLEPVIPDRAGTLEFRQYADVIGDELRSVGFTPVATRDGAQLVAAIDYAENTREALAQRSPVTVGVGGGTGGRNGGIGLGTTFGVGSGRSNDVRISMLEMRIFRTSDEENVWEGRAVTEARVGNDNAGLAAALPGLASD
ncbi:MAG: DUF4136 domain-containing protein, partial [Pacificimonas sp.]